MIDKAAQRFIWFYSVAQLKLKYRYTVLGFLWNFLEPAMFLAILSLIFSVVNNMDIADYAVFLFGALMPWRYFEKSVNTIMDSIVQGDWLLKKLYVSPFALPMTRWVIASIEFLISLSIVFGFFMLIKHPFTVHLVILPLAVVPWAILGLGVGLCCAVGFTFFRDLKTVVQMSLMLVFFSSPILFRADAFDPASLQAAVVRFHPMTYFAALFQKPIYHEVFPSQTDWIVSFGFAIVSLISGALLTKKYKGELYYYL